MKYLKFTIIFIIWLNGCVTTSAQIHNSDMKNIYVHRVTIEDASDIIDKEPHKGGIDKFKQHGKEHIISLINIDKSFPCYSAISIKRNTDVKNAITDTGEKIDSIPLNTNYVILPKISFDNIGNIVTVRMFIYAYDKKNGIGKPLYEGLEDVLAVKLYDSNNRIEIIKTLLNKLLVCEAVSKKTFPEKACVPSLVVGGTMVATGIGLRILGKKKYNEYCVAEESEKEMLLKSAKKRNRWAHGVGITGGILVGVAGFWLIKEVREKKKEEKTDTRYHDSPIDNMMLMPYIESHSFSNYHSTGVTMTFRF